MTTDRRKAVLYLSLTLIIGILIGSLVPGTIHRFRSGRGYEDHRGPARGRMGHKAEWLTRVVVRITQPDSSQMDQLRPILKSAQLKIQTLESASNKRMTEIMDSLKLNIKPILSEEQNRKLEEFSMKARRR